MKMNPKPYLMITRVVNGWIIHRGNRKEMINPDERYVATYESEVRQIVKAHCDAECPNVEQPEGADAGAEMPAEPVVRALIECLECPSHITGNDRVNWEDAARTIRKIDNDNIPF